MKLVSTATELNVLRNICSKDRVISGTLLSSVDDTYFHNEFVVETFERILEQTKTSGDVPSWSVICEDPALTEKTREKLKTAKYERFRNEKEVSAAITRLNEYRQLRGIFEITEQAVSSLRNNKVEPSKVLSRLADGVVALRQNRNAKNEALVFGKGNNSSAFIKEMMEAEQLDFIPTGFASFDDENQGFGFGNLIVLAGSTGGGKSTLAAQLGVNWMKMGEDVTFVPLEMTKKEMSARLMANASGLDVRKILFGKMSKSEKVLYWKQYKNFVLGAKKNGGSLRIFKPQSDMTIEEIMASVYPWGSRIVVIDYISLLKGVDGDDAWQKLGAVARFCKIYAEANNMIVVLLAQLSEEGMIRYAKSIKEHANYMWQFVATATTREQEIINIDQTKARNGRLFPFTLRAEMSTMRIRDLEVEEKEDMESKTKRTTGKGDKGNRFKKGKLGKDSENDQKGKSKPSGDYLKDLADDDDDD